VRTWRDAQSASVYQGTKLSEVKCACIVSKNARHLGSTSLGEPRSMKTLSTNKLFTPVRVGSMQLDHRVVMAPLTRSRSVQPGSIPGDLMLEYYSQRASDGGLIVSEGTSISIAGGGWFGAPGLYSD